MIPDVERASRRFFQIATLERAITRQQSAIAQCADHLKELKKEYDGLILDLRAAARDEGELPLFDRLELELEAPREETTTPELEDAADTSPELATPAPLEESPS